MEVGFSNQKGHRKYVKNIRLVSVRLYIFLYDTAIQCVVNIIMIPIFNLLLYFEIPTSF
jgi:hypothetical protein